MSFCDELREIGISKKNRLAILENEEYQEEKNKRLSIDSNRLSAIQAEIYFANNLSSRNF